MPQPIPTPPACERDPKGKEEAALLDISPTEISQNSVGMLPLY